MAERRFPREAYLRQLRKLELELREWALVYAARVNSGEPKTVQEQCETRYEQLLDVAHTVERARHDLRVLPRLRL